MSIPANDILASKLVALGVSLASYTERVAVIRTHLADGWFNEQGAKRARQSLVRYDTQIGRLLDEMRELLVPAALKPVHYTCVGKSGTYELIGEATGAGTKRGNDHIMVYRDKDTGTLYFRSVPDFGSRMAQLP